MWVTVRKKAEEVEGLNGLHEILAEPEMSSDWITSLTNLSFEILSNHKSPSTTTRTVITVPSCLRHIHLRSGYSAVYIKQIFSFFSYFSSSREQLRPAYTTVHPQVRCHCFVVPDFSEPSVMRLFTLTLTVLLLILGVVFADEDWERSDWAKNRRLRSSPPPHQSFASSDEHRQARSISAVKAVS